MEKKYKNQIRTMIVFLSVFLALPLLASFTQYLSTPNDHLNMSDRQAVVTIATGNFSEKDTFKQSIHTFKSKIMQSKEIGNELSTISSYASSSTIKKTPLKDVKLVPGGQSIGVQLHTAGVLVVGHHLVNNLKGESSPGEQAKVQIGDVILKINNEEIHKMEDVKPYVEVAGKENQTLDLTIQRGKETIVTTLKPMLDSKDSEYRLGLYIRDSAAGIGTMSFYDPESQQYGALGHVISDMDTKKPIEINKGTIVRSSVTAIEKGNNGSPGEKHANFSVNENKIGSIQKNNDFGIFGKLDHSLKNDKYDQAMQVALPHEVKEGPAKILTVLDGEKVEEFEVEVVSSIPQQKAATKGMVIKVTDPNLLERTGGIVQGMSGSPIIQNGKIIGAVTHVFVNDSTSGYGVHIEWMLQEIDIEIDQTLDQAS